MNILSDYDSSFLDLILTGSNVMTAATVPSNRPAVTPATPSSNQGGDQGSSTTTAQAESVDLEQVGQWQNDVMIHGSMSNRGREGLS